MKYILILLCFIVFDIYTASAKEKLPVPRFVSLKSNEINVRTGPNIRYPIKWVFISRNEPVEVVAEFENWRKIKDFSGDEGWIHESMLVGRRYALVKSTKNEYLYNNCDSGNFPIAILAPEYRVQIIECSINNCKVRAAGYKGCMTKDKLYGVYKNEIYK